MGKDLNIGDLVWAKMKGFSFWPGFVKELPTASKKKAQHYIYFYGTDNCAWIPDENIRPHSEEEIRKAKLKKVSSSLQSAIDKIVSESKLTNKSKQIPAEKEIPQSIASTSSEKAEKVIKRKSSSEKAEKVLKRKLSSDRAEKVLKRKSLSSAKEIKKSPKKPLLSEIIPKSPKKPKISETVSKSPPKPVESEIIPESPTKPVESEVPKSPTKPVDSEIIAKPPKKRALSDIISKSPKKPGLSDITRKSPKKPALSDIIPKSPKKPVLSKILPKSSKKPKHSEHKHSEKHSEHKHSKHKHSKHKHSKSSKSHKSSTTNKKSKEPLYRVITVTKPMERFPTPSHSDKGSATTDFMIIKTFIKPPMTLLHKKLGFLKDSGENDEKSKILNVDGIGSRNSTTPVAVIKPNTTLFPDKIINREYAIRIPPPEIDLFYKSESIRRRSIHPTTKRVGFMGLGIIGGRIARNLINNGHNVTVWSRDAEKSLNFKDIGATVAETPSDVVENSDLILNCVSGSLAAKTAVFGNYGVLQGFDKTKGDIIEKGYVEMSTVDPETSKEIAEAITQKGGRYVEAPLSGSVQDADDGCLLLLGGGDRELFNDLDSVFATISKNAYYISCAIGSAAKMNLAMSMYLGTMYASVGECMSLVGQLGLNRNQFLEILDQSPLNCKHLIEKGKVMLKESIETDSALKYQQQNLHMALSLNGTQPLPVSSNANELYKRAKALNYKDHDAAAVYYGATI